MVLLSLREGSIAADHEQLRACIGKVLTTVNGTTFVLWRMWHAHHRDAVVKLQFMPWDHAVVRLTRDAGDAGKLWGLELTQAVELTGCAVRSTAAANEQLRGCIEMRLSHVGGTTVGTLHEVRRQLLRSHTEVELCFHASKCTSQSCNEQCEQQGGSREPADVTLTRPDANAQLP